MKLKINPSKFLKEVALFVTAFNNRFMWFNYQIAKNEQRKSLSNHSFIILFYKNSNTEN